MTFPRRPSTRRTRADERIDALDTSPAGIAAQLEAIRAESDAKVKAAVGEHEEARSKAESERDEYLAALQRERAEFTNFRARTIRERDQERGLAGVDLITKVLILADDFDRAIESRPAGLEGDAWTDGIAAIDRKLRLLLDSEGVTAVEASAGSPFDPREHEAVTAIPGTGLPDGSIVQEVRRGYRLRDRVIRPALVVVAAGDDAEHAARPN
jgi:molecular chaperone GrpE